MKFFDLGLDDPGLRAELDQAYRRVIDSGWMILGRELEAFESEFATYCGASHAVGVGNGYDALVLALRAAGIGPDEEVIVPAHTFAATWLAVLAVGARPVPVEVNSAHYTLEAEAVLAAVTSRTRAVIPVSLYGHPVDMEPLMALAGQHGLFVLEDAAQSQGAAYRGRRTGSLAHATAFSFYPTKNLGALGDAGAVVTSDTSLAERVRRLRNYGSSQKYRHEVVGVNSRLDEMQAAFLRTFLTRLDASNDRRRDLAAAYGRAFGGIQGLATPSQSDWARHVYHLYVVRTAHRDALQAQLRAANIETLIHYPIPCHLQQAFETQGFRRGDFPFAEQLAEEVLSLPMWPGMAVEDVKQVARVVRQASSAANT